MNHCFLTLLSFLCLFCASSAQSLKPTEPQPPKIDASPASLAAVSKYLTVIPEVKGKVFVLADRTMFSIYWTVKSQGYGWLDKNGRVEFVDGYVLENAVSKTINLAKLCEKLFPDGKVTEWSIYSTEKIHEKQISPALAAIMLYRKGEQKLAMRYWKIAVNQLEDEKIAWSSFLNALGCFSPWSQFNAGVNAHKLGQSGVALDYLLRLKLYSPHSFTRYGNGEHLLEDLLRRKKTGILLTKSPTKPSEDYQKWDESRKIKFLISQLDQIDVQQHSQPGGVVFGEDWRVRELVSIGDPAIPALMDCFEHDRRLTRSCHYWRLHHQYRTILSVREAALSVIMSILDESFYSPASTGSNYTGDSSVAHKETVRKIRDYWKKHGKFDANQRMMNRLLDKNESIRRRLNALDILAWHERTLIAGTTVWSGTFINSKKKGVHPLLERFKNPSLAEAAWSLTEEIDQKRRRLIQKLKDDERVEKGELEYTTKQWEFCLRAITKLNDRRLIPVLQEKYANETDLTRKVKLAIVLDALGEKLTLNQLVTGLLQGKVNYQTVELPSIIDDFVPLRHPDCDRFLLGLADPTHPLYDEIVKGLIEEQNPFYEEQRDESSHNASAQNSFFWAHPFVIKVLTDQLANEKESGSSYQIVGDSIIHTLKSGKTQRLHFPPWVNEREQLKIAQIRICDLAQAKLQKLISDIPHYSPLWKKRDIILAELRAKFKTNPPQEIPISFTEHLNLYYVTRYFWFNPPKVMKRLATAEDLEKGSVAFYCKDGGKMIPLKLPIFTYTSDSQGEYPVVIIHAEEDNNGDKMFSCLTPNGLERYFIDELEMDSQ